ncbi:MAG TPA: RDD family protein [Pseudonocardia sp.]
MPRWTAPWLPGATDPGGRAAAYPGERLGAPRSGVGSVAGFGRRLAALTVDWLLAVLIAGLFAGGDPLARGSNYSTTVLGVWFVVTVAAVAAFGITPGGAALGIRVASLRTTVVGVPRALLRTALVALVIPALARDADGRGWHDRAAGTVVVRTRG